MTKQKTPEYNLFSGAQLGRKIKKLRELKDLTQSFVANEMGLSQSAYSKMEQGETDITYPRLEKVASILGVKPEEIIAFNEAMVFNVMNNHHSNNGLIIQHPTMNSEEKKLYEEQIELLKTENEYLKKLLDKLVNFTGVSK